MYNLFSPLIKLYKELYLFSYEITGNYGYSLILLSLFTFIVLYPFNKKAQQLQNKEHKIQEVLSPQIDVIKKQYSGREQYEQLQWLYQRYGYHPLYAIRSALGFVLQIPFLTAAYYMLSGLTEIRGISWGVIPDLGSPDHLLGGINLLPFIMTLVTVLYAFVMVGISKKERTQTIAIGIFFLVLLYSVPSALLIFWTCNLIWSLLDSVLGKKIEWLNDFALENELAFHVIFALSLTVGLLVPTEIYIKNISQLWFDYKDIFRYFLIDTAQYFIVLFIVYIVFGYIKIKFIYLSVLFGIVLGVFLQSYVISINYGVFDGHEIEWTKYSKYGIANTVVWLVCLVAPLIKFRQLKFDTEKIIKLVKPVAFTCIIVQIIVLLFVLKYTPLEKNILFVHGKAGVLTTKDMYNVSTNDNIIVFLLDMFDASLFEEIVKTRPDISAELKDFTYYPDTTSSFGFTHFSLPEILTGKLYDPRDRYPDYLENAWKDNAYYKLLLNNDFNISLYTNGNCVGQTTFIDNRITQKVVMDQTTINYFSNLMKFRIAPHFLKYLYYTYKSNMQVSTLVNSNFTPYEENDRKFYLGLKKGLAFTNKKNVFRFYHLKGTHPPYILDENMELLQNNVKGNKYAQSIGCLKIVNEFIMQLKQHNVYDNTTFVIMADHGYHNMIGGRPVFLIKRPHDANKSMLFDARPLTVSDLMPLLIERFGATNTLLRKMNGDRFFYFENENKGRRFERYLVKSPARDIDSWVSIGPVERRQIKDNNYKVGEIIDFSCFGNAFKYKVNGWGDREETFGSMITQREATLTLSLINNETYTNDLYLEIICNPLLGFFAGDSKEIFRDLKLYADQKLIGNWHFTEYDTKVVSCNIPAELLNKKNLSLRFVVINPTGSSLPEAFQINKIRITKNKQ